MPKNLVPDGKGGYFEAGKGNSGHHFVPDGQGGYYETGKGNSGQHFISDGHGGFFEKGKGNSGHHFVPDGQGGYCEKGEGDSGQRFTPDGCGGFVGSVGSGGSSGGSSSGGLEGIGVIIFSVSAILIAPFLFGYIFAFSIVGVLTGFTPLPVTTAIPLYLFVSLFYLVIFGVPYHLFFTKMSFGGKIGWGLIVLSIILSPYCSLYSQYQGEIFGFTTPVKIETVQTDFNPISNGEEIPASGISQRFCANEINSSIATKSSLSIWDSCSHEENTKLIKWSKYLIKNDGTETINVFLTYYGSFCFADGNNEIFSLAPNDKSHFFCAVKIKRAHEFFWTNLNSCVAVFPEQISESQKHRKLCENNNWK